MKKKLIYSLFSLFALFSLGSGISMFSMYKTTKDLQSLINLHRVEIIRQNLVISTQTVQSNLYTFGTVFGQEIDDIVDNVIELGDSANRCLGCHHSKEIKEKLLEVNAIIEQYKDTLSYLITTSADPERVERLRAVAINIGGTLLAKSQEMALIAGARMNSKTIDAIREVQNSRIILIVTLVLSFSIALAIAITMTRQITKPIYELVVATGHIAKGDFSKRVDVKSPPEIGALAESFNAMAQNLQITYEKMEEKTRQLIEAQEELVRKEKLSILGQLSGSVGHELRNPLGVISNAVYYLQTVNPNADETTKEYLGIIKDEVETSQRIISDLLEFARTKAPDVTQVHAGELVAQSLEKCTIPATVSVNLDLPDVLPPLRVDPVQIKQVFINFIMNAVQAMPNGGTLEIKAEEASGGKELKVSFTDTGEGIAPENMGKLFQPLFTTKARGIGLGLTASQNLTENNGGRIEVESKVGEGTTFTVTLPAGEA